MRNTALTVLALSAFFTLARALAYELVIRNTSNKDDVHPYCRCSEGACQPFVKGIVDLTPALRAPGIPDGACIFNPALIRVTGNLFCVFTRVYIAADEEKRCVPGGLDRPPFMDAWNGSLGNIIALVRIRKQENEGKFSVTMVGHRYLKFNYEDGRIFRDQRGRVYLYVSLPFGKYGGDRASVNTVFRVFITCHRGPSLQCDTRLGPPRLLRYDRSLAWDKNWVPWNGTSLMSYSHYGPLGPHSVFNWSTYSEPVPHARFDTVSHENLFYTFSRTFGRLIHLSGGTPAILEPSGTSYLAVGHLRVHPACLHPQAIPGLDKLIGNAARSNCAHLMKLSVQTKDTIPFRSFVYRGPDGLDKKHYHVDYGFFMYRFSAAPPYTITHISHGFLPPSDSHYGITFPSALERFGPDYAIAYGDADQASKLLLLDQSDVNKLLVPLALMERRMVMFSLCTLPLVGDFPPS